MAAPSPASSASSPDPASFRVRAIAAAAHDANAFGRVAVACLPEGLELLFVSIAGRTPDYAPRLPVSGTIVVPWSKVKRVHPVGAALRLEVDRACTPFNRLTLVHLTAGGRSLEDSLEQRRRIRKVAWVIAPIASVAALLLARAWGPSLGALALAAIALAVGGAALFVGSAMARDVALGGVDGLDLRDALVAHLAAYGVTIRPGAALDVRPIDDRLEAPPSALLDALRGLRTPALGVAAFAIVAQSALGIGRALLDVAPHEQVAQVEQGHGAAAAGDDAPPTRAGVVAAVALPAALAVAPALTTGATTAAPEPCQCPRADSPLWASGLPRLSLLVAPHGPVAGPGRVDLDVVAINNGATPVHDVEIAVQLYRRSRTDEAGLEPRGRRGLFWGGELPPGAAGRWRLQARADAIAPTATVPGLLGEGGIDPAPADTFSTLLGARTRAARLHGAMMLAYLRDPRAADAVAKLTGGEHEEEALLLDRIAGAAAPVFACATQVEPLVHTLRVRACLVNGTASAVSGVHARLVARDVDPTVRDPAATWAFVVSDVIPPGRGVVVAHDEPLDTAVDASRTWFELRVDGAAD